MIRAYDEYGNIVEDYEKQIYNKAVDDFVKMMKLWADNIEKIRNSEAFFTIHDIECHAKLLKEHRNK